MTSSSSSTPPRRGVPPRRGLRFLAAVLAVGAVAAPACTRTTVEESVGTTQAPPSTTTTTTDEPPRSTTTTRPPSTTTTTSAPVGVPSGWTLETDDSGLQFAHPADWQVQDSELAAAYVFIDSDDEFRRNINFLLQSGPETTDLETYVAVSAMSFGQAGAVIESEGPTTLSGLPAYEWTYTANFQGYDLKFRAVAAATDEGVWLVTYTSQPENFDEVLPTVEQLLGTVVLPEG